MKMKYFVCLKLIFSILVLLSTIAVFSQQKVVKPRFKNTNQVVFSTQDTALQNLYNLAEKKQQKI